MNNTSPIQAIRRRWWIILAFALVGALIGGLPKPEQVEEQATTFKATHTMLANDGSDTSIISPSQVTLLTTAGEVPRRVAESIDFDGNPAELASQITATFDFETSALTITTEQDTAEAAELIANSFADQLNAYLAERQDQLYQDRLSASRTRVDELRTELEGLSAELDPLVQNPPLSAEIDSISRQYALALEQNDTLEASPDRLSFTTLARAEAVPEVDRGLSAPTGRSTRAAMGLVVGAALGVVVTIVVGRLDNKIRSRDQVEDLVGMRARAAIPRVGRTEGGVVVSTGRHDPLSDAYRTVRNLVGFVQAGLPPARRARITLVVSPSPGDGKTSLAANLASSFLEIGQRTIAVNTDFRRPRLHQAIMGAPSPDMPFDLHELDDVPRRVITFGTAAENLKILDLSSVPGSPGELVRSSMRQIERLEDGTDQIVVDTSPVGATAEVLDLVPMADVIVLVTRVGNTSIEATERTIAILRDIATAPIIFVVGGVKTERNPYHVYNSRPRERTAVEPHDDETSEPSEPAVQ